MKLNKKNYNTTDLDPEKSFERHIFHRDQFAHYLRWTHVLKNARIDQITCDFGCGNGNLLEVLYRNKFKQKKYVGIDIRNSLKKDLEKLDWCEFIQEDLVIPQNNTDFTSIQADVVVSFEVFEHVGKQNAQKFLKNFMDCGCESAIYYLSTPNYDEKVGAAGNHTYDSGDSRGVAVQEHSHQEIQKHLIQAGFTIVNKYGTFASIKDYKHLLNEWQQNMFDALKDYYDSNLLSNMMAPFFPEQSRNTIWVLKKTK
jgi:cyclopropane fatty-acyl-phospholipid synthase-like methyltransferase